ncbi:hypothetical protein [Cytobacillus dafuensis]|uniref:Uncharacterized protein n=1 Tax=Cytobacillus dafuensis TaxID=1742359 RepID=A0A5B8Z368_CYTDA|nr:hypothetical protein [Cytobacillus dafuensis]QED46049.1 hypothetical protein FSZ17_01295 [Cytobacillus dafuensis]
MEQRIENAIDHAFESISPQLNFINVGFGIVLVILGIVLYYSGKRTKGKSGKTNAGLICAAIGIFGVVNGIIRMF